MPLFPVLPVLDSLSERVAPRLSSVFQTTVFVCVQHLLETTGSLFESLIALGAQPERIFVIGKLYSTNTAVADRLRQLGIQVLESTPPSRVVTFAQAMEQDISSMWGLVEAIVEKNPPTRIVILDDGGRCIRGLPEYFRLAHQVVGIEQTTSGLNQLAGGLSIPVIQVASSAAKRILEPPLIARAVLGRVRQVLVSTPTHEAVCGVIGMGHIGRAMAVQLQDMGFGVVTADIDPSAADSVPGIQALDTPDEVLLKATHIFGCTGSDVFARSPLKMMLSGTKTLASCSSEDVEFAAILRRANGLTPAEPLQDVVLPLNGASVRVLRGGFPINFDGSRESVPSADIQVTRGLLLAAAVQAVLCDHAELQPPRPEMVAACAQAYVVDRWMKVGGCAHLIDPESVRGFTSTRWIEQHSGGMPSHCGSMETLFCQVTQR